MVRLYTVCRQCTTCVLCGSCLSQFQICVCVSKLVSLLSLSKFSQCQSASIVCGARTADPPVGGVGMDRVWTKHAVPQRRGPVMTTRHEARQMYATRPSTRRYCGSARPDSDTTVQYAPGTRPLLETELTFGATKGL